MRKFLLIFLASLGLLGIAYAAEIEDLETTDANNTARFPENMAPSAVNNGARALEGLLARFYVDLGCRVSTAGSSNAYTFAASQAVTSYFDGLILCFDANFANTGSATLNVDTLGAKTLKRNGANLPAGAIEANQKVLVTYDGTNFELLSVARAITNASDIITTRGDIITGDSSADAVRLAVGSSGEYLGSDGTDTVWRAITGSELPTASDTLAGILETATQAEQETGTATNKTVTPGRQHFHPSAAKAWVTFNAAGTRQGSFNVSSVTDVATGNWTVNFTTAITPYSAVGSVRGQSDTDANSTIFGQGAKTSTTSKAFSKNASDTLVDSNDINVVFFGDH